MKGGKHMEELMEINTKDLENLNVEELTDVVVELNNMEIEVEELLEDCDFDEV